MIWAILGKIAAALLFVAMTTFAGMVLGERSSRGKDMAGLVNLVFGAAAGFVLGLVIVVIAIHL